MAMRLAQAETMRGEKQTSSSGSWESALDILAEKNGTAPGTPVRKQTPLKDP